MVKSFPAVLVISGSRVITSADVTFHVADFIFCLYFIVLEKGWATCLFAGHTHLLKLACYIRSNM